MQSRKKGLWIALLISVTLCACETPARSPDVKPGLAAPDFTLEAVRGGTHHLETLRGQAVLLSFLNIQSNASASRSQVVFLKSMMEQYGPQGTVILIADASHLATGRAPRENDVLNFTYDWQLDAIPVLIDDHSGTVARRYDVTNLPTTFLIDAEGVIQQRWDGFTSAPQLAFALEALVGPPAFREAEAASPVRVACPDETPAQARFAGVGLARSLSEEIWAVDGGQVWGVGGPWPTQWIVIDRAGKIQGDELHLLVTAVDLDSGTRDLLVNEDVEPLPEDETLGLLASLPGSAKGVYLLTTSVTLQTPGCFRVEAIVTHRAEGAPLYTGQAIIPAD